MSRYKIHDPSGMYYMTMSVVGWIDIFSRQRYRDIVIDSLKYCQKEKGLILLRSLSCTSNNSQFSIKERGARKWVSEP